MLKAGLLSPSILGMVFLASAQAAEVDDRAMICTTDAHNMTVKEINVEGSFYKSALRVGVSNATTMATIRAISTRADPGETLGAGTTVRIAYADDHCGDKRGVPQYIEVSAAAAHDADPSLQLYRYHHPNGDDVYFDGHGYYPGAGLLLAPLDGEPILSSDFGMRKDPFSGKNAWHEGVDYAAPEGADVYAAQDGYVIFAGEDPNKPKNGIHVSIMHSNGVQTSYLHLSAVNVRVNQRVAQGAHIGDVGNTGVSSGPHLHFAVYKDGQAIDPLGGDIPNAYQLEGFPLGEYYQRVTRLNATVYEHVLFSDPPHHHSPDMNKPHYMASLSQQ